MQDIKGDQRQGHIGLQNTSQKEICGQSTLLTIRTHVDLQAQKLW